MSKLDDLLAKQMHVEYFGNQIELKVSKLGYLFEFETFMEFLMGIAKELLNISIRSLILLIEMSEGIVTLRAKVGKSLTFMNMLDNYE